MKNQFKSVFNIAACMFISTLSGYAAAQSQVNLSGTVGAAACTVGVYDSDTGGSALASINAGSLAAGALTTANPAGTTAGSTTFYVRVPAGCSAGSTSKWNVGFSAPVTGNYITNSATSPASNISFDIASFSSGSATSLASISATAPVNVAAARTQNGYSTDTLVADAQRYALRYVKTAAANTAVGSGPVAATLTITTFLP